MRRAAKVDANQADIVKALRQAGASVLCLHRVGQGCPDLLVGKNEVNLLMECKDGSLPPSWRTLSPDEAEFFETWRGQVKLVKSVDEALEVLRTGS